MVVVFLFHSGVFVCFSFSILDISFYSLLVCKVFDEKSSDSLMEFPSYVRIYFLLAVFKIFSLSFI